MNNQIFNTVKDLEMNKVYEFKDKLGKKVFIQKTLESERMNKVVNWFSWPTETGTFEEDIEEEKEMIGFDTFQYLLKSKIIF